MGWKNSRDFEAYQHRRSERYASIGRKLEVRVALILHEMKERGEIDDFTYFQPNTPEDHEGKDFRAVKIINGKHVEKCFGVTISQRRLHQSKIRHNSIPQFCFPPVTNKHTIERKILELFPLNGKARV